MLLCLFLCNSSYSFFTLYALCFDYYMAMVLFFWFSLFGVLKDYHTIKGLFFLECENFLL